MAIVNEEQYAHSYAKEIAKRVEDGTLTKISIFKGEFSWLSNFYWHYLMKYTVEHEFQAAKASGNDHVLAARILTAETPGEAKKLGRRAKLPSNWETDKELVMKRALEHKFNRSPMKEWLLATGEIPLQEGNYWHDNEWGNCHCVKCHSAPGNNKLGKLLMNIRSELRERS